MSKTALSKTKPKDLARSLLQAHPKKFLQDLIKELSVLLASAEAKVYYCGTLDKNKKQRVLNWLAQKTNGNYEVMFIEDPALIAGFKVVVGDLILDASVINELKEGLKGNATFN